MTPGMTTTTRLPRGAALAGLLTGLLVSAAALASCAPDTSAPELQPRRETIAPAGADAGAADEPDLTPTLNAAEIALTAQAVALANAGCLQCHTDEEQLRSLAVEEEVVSLSEGPG